MDQYMVPKVFIFSMHVKSNYLFSHGHIVICIVQFIMQISLFSEIVINHGLSVFPAKDRRK